MQALYTLVAVMLVVVLYHVLFIVVDLRKSMRRMNNLTQQVESVLMKPLSMTEKALTWVTHSVEKAMHRDEHKHPHHSHAHHEKKDA